MMVREGLSALRITTLYRRSADRLVLRSDLSRTCIYHNDRIRLEPQESLHPDEFLWIVQFLCPILAMGSAGILVPAE